MKIVSAILATLAILLSGPFALAQSTDAEQKAILVTGASTGIGRNIAERLAAEGHFVYAGARKQADIDALSAIDNVQGIRLDVTVQEEIDAALETITKEGRGLYGLINNAGVSVSGPLIEIEESEMQFQMDVNLFGPYRVTKAFAPLIIASKGRITTTGSVSGIIAGVLYGPYSMSKHAVEAFTDSLAAEMSKFDVQVSIIEPGNYNSAIVESKVRRMQERGRTPDGSLYKEELEALLRAPTDRSVYKEPDDVSAAMMHFLFDEHPKRRYLVVPNEQTAAATIRTMISELVQLNERHEYSYDRAELIRMLDERLGTPESK